MNLDETVAELRATVDYVRDITEQSDSMDIEELVAVQDELRRVQKAAGDAVSLCDTELLRQLEGGVRQIGQRVFARGKNYVSRHDHDAIAERVYEQAVESARDPDSGDVHALAALRTAINMMRRVYLAPATKAKTGVLEKLGVDRGEYESREFKGWQVSVTELDEP